MNMSVTRGNGTAASAFGGADSLVINLCASMTTLIPHPQVLALLQAYRIYQLVRTEDGRPRHRLRVGFFSDPRDAQALLTNLRQHYPTAFVAPACADDLRFARTQDCRGSPSMLLRALAVEPATVPQSKATPAATPAPARTPAAELSLATDNAAPLCGRTVDRARAERDRAAILASAQSLELAESRSDDAIVYAIQLVRSPRPLNVAALPQLDIFSAFNLYTVKLKRDATITHALRLGFFRERVSAEQVARYLKDHFPTRELIHVGGEEQRKYGGARPSVSPATNRPKPNSSTTHVVRLGEARERPREAVRLQPQPASGTPRRPPPNTALSTPRPAPKVAPPARNGSAKTLSQLLLEEARQVALSQSGIRRQPATSRMSLLTRLVGRIRGSTSDRG